MIVKRTLSLTLLFISRFGRGNRVEDVPNWARLELCHLWIQRGSQDRSHAPRRIPPHGQSKSGVPGVRQNVQNASRSQGAWLHPLVLMSLLLLGTMYIVDKIRKAIEIYLKSLCDCHEFSKKVFSLTLLFASRFGHGNRVKDVSIWQNMELRNLWVQCIPQDWHIAPRGISSRGQPTSRVRNVRTSIQNTWQSQEASLLLRQSMIYWLQII